MAQDVLNRPSLVPQPQVCGFARRLYPVLFPLGFMHVGSPCVYYQPSSPPCNTGAHPLSWVLCSYCTRQAAATSVWTPTPSRPPRKRHTPFPVATFSARRTSPPSPLPPDVAHVTLTRPPQVPSRRRPEQLPAVPENLPARPCKEAARRPPRVPGRAPRNRSAAAAGAVLGVAGGPFGGADE